MKIESLNLVHFPAPSLLILHGLDTWNGDNLTVAPSQAAAEYMRSTSNTAQIIERARYLFFIAKAKEASILTYARNTAIYSRTNKSHQHDMIAKFLMHVRNKN